MSDEVLNADYLVVGAGAMGMAFVDVLLTETDATVVLIDRRSRPGGHWTDAYPFVRLHQPSAFYGVNSRPLGTDMVDQVGWNAGLYELASAAEVCTYFDQLLHQRFLPSGRVQFFQSCNYDGDRRFTSSLSGVTKTVAPTAKVVDASYMHVTVPSTSPPSYDIASGMRLVPVNGLASVVDQPASYVIVGAGKTGMDACLWLLANDVDPDDITWIMPRDSWLLDRANIQPGPSFAPSVIGSIASQMEVSAQSATVEELFEGLERTGVLSRIDPSIDPTMYRCATVTQAELQQLRRIDNVVRLGRVVRIDESEIVLDDGTIPTGPDVLHVDCSADGLAKRPVVPTFDDDRITLQTVRTCQPVFSAAFIAHVEAAYDDAARKNELCNVVPHPDTDLDWLRVTLANTLNGVLW
ncbi:MAG: NAD(P)-binding protein, partial [Acidimicrobiales bacterium]